MSQYDTTEWLLDGCLIRTAPDGSWDICWPDGTHTQGQAESREAARAMALEEHKEWVYRQWQKGSPQRGQVFAVPLR